MTLSLRIAEASDAPAITALIESAYRGEGSRRGWTTEEHLIDGNRTNVAEITENITASNKRFIMAFDGGTLVGCAMIKDDHGKGYFGLFAVRPELQGGGLGKQILTYAEQKTHELWGCKVMTMTVINIREELVAYYERRGYSRTGTKTFPFEQEPGAKRKDFHFVVLSKPIG